MFPYMVWMFLTNVDPGLVTSLIMSSRNNLCRKSQLSQLCMGLNISETKLYSGMVPNSNAQPIGKYPWAFDWSCPDDVTTSRDPMTS